MNYTIPSQAEDMFWWGHRSDRMGPIQPPLIIGMSLGYPGFFFVMSDPELKEISRSQRLSLFISRRVTR